MNKLNNYKDVDSLDLLIKEIEKAIDSRLYLAALHMALSIPDMLGGLAYPEITKTTTRYIKWFDDNVKNLTFEYLYSKNPLIDDNKFPHMCGSTCFALRNSLFHDGQNSLSKKAIDEFVLSFTNDDYVKGNYAGDCDDNRYLYISCKGLCKEMVEAAKVFRKKNPNLNYPKIRVNEYGAKINNALVVD